MRRSGAGIGTTLISHAHHALDTHGIEVTLLNYAVMNPCRAVLAPMGYRPLWTT